jgi:hypothetical protein
VGVVIEKIEPPVARASVTWKSAEEGGRSSGPPSAPVYSATAVFRQGDEEEIQPDWPVSADQVSILLEAENPDGDEETGLYKVALLVRELALPFLNPGTELLIMEGPRVVASARVETVYE